MRRRDGNAARGGGAAPAPGAAPGGAAGAGGGRPAADEPLVLTLLNYSVRAVRATWYATCWLVWLPPHLLCTASSRLGSHRLFRSSRGFYTLAWLPRWLCVSMVPVLVLAQCGGAGALGWMATARDTTPVRVLVAVPASIGTAIALWIGRGRRMHGNPLVAQAYGDTAKAILWVQQDLAAAVCACFTIAGVLRAPPLLNFARKAPAGGGEAYGGPVTRQVFVEASRTFVDWIHVVMGLPLVALPFRAAHVYRNFPAGYWDRRRFVREQALATVLEAPLFVLGGVPLLLSGYRTVSFARAWWDAEAHDRLMVTLSHVWELVCDLPYIGLGAALTCTVYNIPRLLQAMVAPYVPVQIDGVPYSTDAQWRRWHVARLAYETLWDAVAVVAGVAVVLPSIYRIPATWQAATAVREARKNAARRAPVSVWLPGGSYVSARPVNPMVLSPTLRWQREIAKQAMLVTTELPVWAACVPVIATGWRAPVLVRHMASVPLDDRATVATRHLWLWAREATVLPLFAAVLATGVHAPAMARAMLRASRLQAGDVSAEAQERRSRVARRAVVAHFTMLLADVPCALMAGVVLATGYRAPAFIKAARAPARAPRPNARRARPAPAGAAGAARAGDGANAARNAAPAALTQAWHRAAVAQFTGLVTDLPYIALGAVTTAAVWRSPLMWRELCCERDGQRAPTTDVARRAVVAKHAARAVVDLVAAACGAAVLVTGWRAPRLWTDVRAAIQQRGGAAWVLPWHYACARHLVHQLHPLEILCIPSVFVSAWRAPSLYRALSGTPQHPLPADCQSDAAKRRTALVHMGLALADVACLPLAAVVLLTGFRARRMIAEVQDALAVVRAAGGGFPWAPARACFMPHRAVVKQALLVARDIPFFALVGLTMVLVPWRARRLLAELRAEGNFRARFMTTSRTLTHALDIPAAIVFTAMLATWRAPVMVAFGRSRYRQLSGGMGAAELAAEPDAHKMPLYRFVAGQTLQLLLDTPFALLAPLMLWRVPAFVRAMWPARVVGDGALMSAGTVAVAESPAEMTRTGQGTMDRHGIRLRLRGKLPQEVVDLRAKQISLSVLGEEFWTAASAVAPAGMVALARATMHPLSLCPSIAAAADFHQRDVDTTLEFGSGARGGAKVSHAMLKRILTKLCIMGDTALTLRLDFYAGGRVFGRTRGHLCTMTTSAQLLLTCLHTGNPINLVVSETAPRPRVVAAADPPAPALAAPPAAPAADGLTAWAARLLILRTAGMVVADVACVGLAALSSVLPWRGWVLYKQLAQSSSGFHMAVLGNFKRALWPNIVLEPLAVAACMLAPWRVPKLLRALFLRDDQAHDRARRTRRLIAVPIGALIDAVVMTMAGVVTITAVRAPGLVSGIVRVLRGGAPPLRDPVVKWFDQLRAAARRGQPGAAAPPQAQDGEVQPHEYANMKMRLRVGAVVLRQFGMVTMDFLQVLEVAFITITMIEIPSTLARMARFARVAWRDWQKQRRIKRARALQEAAARARAAAAAAAAGGAGGAGAGAGAGAGGTRRHPFGRMPWNAAAAVMAYLPAEDLARASQVNRVWHKAAERDLLWLRAYRRRWGDTPPELDGAVGRRVVTSVRALFTERVTQAQRLARQRQEADAHRILVAPATPAEVAIRDYSQGFRFLVHHQFIRSVLRFPHFLLLPFKLLGLLMTPFGIALVVLRYNSVRALHDALPRPIAHNHPLRVVIRSLWDYHTPRHEYLQALKDVRSFDKWHRLAWSWTVVGVLTVAQHLALGVVAVNMAATTVLTLGAPIVSCVLGPAPMRVLNSLMLSFAVPALIALNAYIFFLPNLAAGAWLSSWFGAGASVAWSGVTTVLGWGTTIASRFLPAAISAPIAGAASSAAAPASAFAASVVAAAWNWVTLPAQILAAGLSGATVAAPTTVPVSVLPRLLPTYHLPIQPVQTALSWLLAPFNAVLRMQVTAAWTAAVSTIPLTRRLGFAVQWLASSRIVQQALWSSVVIAGWLKTSEIMDAVFRGADAFLAYRLGWRGIRLAARLIGRGIRAAATAVGRVLRWFGRGYDSILATSTRACKGMGIAGEVLLIPVTVAWFGWPIASPWLFGVSRSLMLPAAGVSLALMVRSRGVINGAWR